jgi:uncharacterized LabA/DUF88 family protein
MAQRTAYLFIDGGFLDDMVRETERRYPQFGPLHLNYHVISSFWRTDRCFYYDAYPERKDNQSPEEYESALEAKRKKYFQISVHDGVHIREGVARFDSVGRKLRQKGVDILFALDVYKAALNGGIAEAHLVASDFDFFPLLECLRETSVKSVLHCHKKRTSPELLTLADIVQPISPFTILAWAGISIEVEGIISWTPFDPKMVQNVECEGWFNGQKATIFRMTEGGDFSFCCRLSAHDPNQVVCGHSIQDVIDDVENRLRQHIVFA